MQPSKSPNDCIKSIAATAYLRLSAPEGPWLGLCPTEQEESFDGHGQSRGTPHVVSQLYEDCGVVAIQLGAVVALAWMKFGSAFLLTAVHVTGFVGLCGVFSVLHAPQNPGWAVSASLHQIVCLANQKHRYLLLLSSPRSDVSYSAADGPVAWYDSPVQAKYA